MKINFITIYGARIIERRGGVDGVVLIGIEDGLKSDGIVERWNIDFTGVFDSWIYEFEKLG